MERRRFMQWLVALPLLGVLPRMVQAAWPKQAFEADKEAQVLQSLYGVSSHQNSDRIRFQAPEIAENGAVVPLTVETDIPARDIAFLVQKNPQPLAARFSLGEGTVGLVSTRIKMATSSDITVLVQGRDNKLYSATKNVKVTIGGCGG